MTRIFSVTTAEREIQANAPAPYSPVLRVHENAHNYCHNSETRLSLNSLNNSSQITFGDS
jgi:hypothetical protein